MQQKTSKLWITEHDIDIHIEFRFAGQNTMKYMWEEANLESSRLFVLMIQGLKVISPLFPVKDNIYNKICILYWNRARLIHKKKSREHSLVV